MFSDLPLIFDNRILFIAAFGIYFIGGVVKGTLGIGFPTTAVSLLAQITDARTAISVVIVPMLITNIWQVWRSSDVMQLAIRFRTMILFMLIFIAVFSQVSARFPVSTLTAVLGFIVALYALHSLYAKPLVLKESHDTLAQCVSGMLSGIMGGLVSVWAPPILVYLRAKRLDKDQFVAAAGLFLLAGSTVLLLSYVNTGVLTKDMWLISSLLVIPAVIGFEMGERIRKQLSTQRFERLLLWFFLIMGLNLIRRAIL